MFHGWRFRRTLQLYLDCNNIEIQRRGESTIVHQINGSMIHPGCENKGNEILFQEQNTTARPLNLVPDHLEQEGRWQIARNVRE